MANVKLMWDTIVLTISTALDFIYNSIIIPTLTALQEFWLAYGENIMAAALVAWNAIVTTVEDAIALVKKIVAAFTAAFQGDWETFGRLIVEIFFDAWALMIKTLKDAGMILLTAVAGIVLDVIAVFQNTDWGEVGDNIIHSIVDGLNRTGGAILEALKGIISRAIANAIASFGGGNNGGAASGAGYASGGFTGYGSAMDVAGMVHRGEYVFNADAVKNLGLKNLDRLHETGQSGANAVTGAAVNGGAGSQDITNDNSSRQSIMMVNPKFNGVSDVPNFLDLLEGLVTS